MTDRRKTIKLNTTMQAIVDEMVVREPVLTGGSPTAAVELALREWYQRHVQEVNDDRDTGDIDV